MPRLIQYLRALAISILVWVGVDLVFWLPTLFESNVKEVNRLTPYRFLVGWLAWWGVFALATPLVFALARRWPLQKEWVRSALKFGAVLLAMSVANVLVRAVVYYEMLTVAERADLMLPADFPTLAARLLRGGTPLFLLLFAGLAGVGYAVDGRRRLHERELRNQQLANELSRAQLDTLKGQLQPHFLFNTLHAIGVTAPHDGVKASRMIVHLGDLLRRTLDTHKHQLVPLREELELLAPYLEIQKLRFADRLSVRLDIPAAVTECLVPSLMLQPIVENSIRHGIEAKSGAGTITIRARADDEALVVEVEDDGRGLQSGRYDPSQDGIGLSATRARISKLFDGQGSFALAPSPAGGAVARMRLPRLTFPSARPRLTPPRREMRGGQHPKTA